MEDIATAPVRIPSIFIAVHTGGTRICEGQQYVARVTATPRGYIIWASPTSSYIDNTHTHLRYITYLA